MVVRPQDLPPIFPIFPLPNVVLFPSARLPLHIFEPRYRQMTADALEGDRVIGMVLLREMPTTNDPALRPDVYEIGCAGRIGDFKELPDGRFNFILEGISRFRILRELDDSKLYRTVEAELLQEPSYEELEPTTRQLLETLRAELEEHLLELARRTAPQAEKALRERVAALDPVKLVHAVAFGIDCKVIEKQSLLDANGPVLRSELLTRLLEFRRAETQHSAGSDWIN